jgi:hypothetical protein
MKRLVIDLFDIGDNTLLYRVTHQDKSIPEDIKKMVMS